MGRQAASARRQLPTPPPASRLYTASAVVSTSPAPAPAIRALLFTAVLATACLALGLQVGLLAVPPPSAGVVIAPAPVTTESVSGLSVRTIVAYSLEAQLQQAPLTPCPAPVPSPPNIKPTRNNHVWQTPSSKSDTFLLAAYYDGRVQLDGRAYPSIRIIAMLYGNTNVSLYCQVWFKSGFSPVITRALRTEIWAEQWDSSYDRAYRPFLLSCPVTRVKDGTIPHAVSVVEGDPCGEAKTLLQVPAPVLTPRARKVAVCVKGLDFAEDRSIRLVEWLEVNRLLGAEKFFIYLYHVHPNMSRVLEYYQGLGEVEVVQLTLPGHQPNVPVQRTKFLRSNIWQKRRNELVSYNDCLYRNLNDYQFILPIDIDEIIVPIYARTWKAMFRQIFNKYPNALQNYASFSVQNAYFLEDFGINNNHQDDNNNNNNNNNNNVPEYLHMLRYTERSANFSPLGQSVKSFIATQNTLTVFNHYALHALYPAMQTRLLLDTDVAQMNHYQKHCSPLLSLDCNDNFLRYHKQDLLLSRYKQPLKARVQIVLKNLRLI